MTRMSAGLTTLCLTVLLAAAEPASATFPGQDGLIARGGADGLHVMKPNRSRDRLLSGVGRVRDPTWSPDGGRIAFSATRDGGVSWSIYVVDLPTGWTRQLTSSGARDLSPSWSGNGRWVAFRRAGAVPGLYRVRLRDASEHRTLTGASIRDAEAAPSGARIAYVSDGDVYGVEASGERVRRIADFPGGDGELEATSAGWSPDGRRLVIRAALDAGCGGCDQLWTVRRDGSGLGPLTSGPGDHPGFSYHGAFWAPDGRSIAFCAEGFYPDAFTDLLAVRPDGSGTRLLAHRCGSDWQALRLPLAG